MRVYEECGERVCGVCERCERVSECVSPCVM